MVVAYLLLGGFEFHAFFFDEESDESDFFDVGFGVETGSAVVAMRFYDGEFTFPEAQSRSRQPYQLGHFANFVVFFRKIFHGDITREISVNKSSVHHVASVFRVVDHLGIFFGGKVLEIVVDGVLRHTFKADFVVKVRAGRFTGITYFADKVAAFYFLAG